MPSCKFCLNIVSYDLFERYFFYNYKNYVLFGMCFECMTLFGDMFNLKKQNDKKILEEEENKILQPF